MAAVLLLLFSVCCGAHGVSAEIEECHRGSDNAHCRALALDDDLSLIQKKMEVGLADGQLGVTADNDTKAKDDSKAKDATKPKDDSKAKDDTKAKDAKGDSIGNSTGDITGKEDFVWPWSGWQWKDHRPLSDNVTASWDIYIVSSLISWFIWLVLALCVWQCCFPAVPQIFNDPEDPVKTFKYQHFSCFQRPKICCCAFFCPGLQWADTMHLAGFLKVYIGLAIFFACALVNSLTLGGCCMYGVFTSALVILYRQRLREKLGMKSWTCTSCLFDCMYVCFCPFCAISQEAQVVRYAYQKGGVVPGGVVQTTIPGAGGVPAVDTRARGSPFSTSQRSIPASQSIPPFGSRVQVPQIRPQSGAICPPRSSSQERVIMR